MKHRIQTFEDYFDSAREIEKEFLDSNPPLLSALRTHHHFFAKYLFSDQASMSPFQSLLSLHAFTMHLCSIRIAISGHGAATFPLFRVALEASCYAFLIGETPELEKIWLERNTTEDALKACKKQFRSAVKEAAAKIQSMEWASSTTQDWITEAYQAAIDFGAHPNPKAIFPYVRLDQSDPKAHVVVSLVGLHDAASSETRRSLIACLEYGLIVALVTLSCLDEQPDDTIAAFNGLYELKDNLTERYFPGTLPTRSNR